MWTLAIEDEGIIAELDVRGRRLRAVKEALAAMLLLIIGFSIITLPDELLNRSDVISPLGRLAWHSVLGLLAGVAVFATRWNRRTSWVATPTGVWFSDDIIGQADLPAANIRSVQLDERPLHRKALLIHTTDDKRVVLCRGFKPGQNLDRLRDQLQRWYD